jgi:hypothetical protein
MAHKSGRPFVYESDDDRPVTVSLRIPRDLYDAIQRRVHQRHQTMTEALLAGARLWLANPTDPHDVILSDDNTVIQRLQRMVDAAVEAALTARQGSPVTHTNAAAPHISHDDNTILQESPSTAASEPSPPPKGGRPLSALGKRVRDVLAAHPEGLTAEEVRVHARADRPLGDILLGMKRKGQTRTQGKGKQMRYVLA